jgi:hypothetical protein
MDTCKDPVSFEPFHAQVLCVQVKLCTALHKSPLYLRYPFTRIRIGILLFQLPSSIHQGLGLPIHYSAYKKSLLPYLLTFNSLSRSIRSPPHDGYSKQPQLRKIRILSFII